MDGSLEDVVIAAEEYVDDESSEVSEESSGENSESSSSSSETSSESSMTSTTTTTTTSTGQQCWSMGDVPPGGPMECGVSQSEFWAGALVFTLIGGGLLCLVFSIPVAGATFIIGGIGGWALAALGFGLITGGINALIYVYQYGNKATPQGAAQAAGIDSFTSFVEHAVEGGSLSPLPYPL